MRCYYFPLQLLPLLNPNSSIFMFVGSPDSIHNYAKLLSPLWRQLNEMKRRQQTLHVIDSALSCIRWWLDCGSQVTVIYVYST